MKKLKLKNVLTTLLTVALTATLAIGGTLAYLTDDAGKENNVFSVGDIDVSLDEDVDIIGEGGEVEKKEDGAEYTEIMPGDYLKKEVTVTNKGKTPAYVAVTVTLKNPTGDYTSRLSKAVDDYYENLEYTEEQIQEVYDNIFDGWGINYSHNNEYGEDTRNTITAEDKNVLKVDYAETINNYWLYSKGNWFFGEYEDADHYWVDDWKAKGNFDKGYYTKDMGSYEARYTYYLLLPAGESSTLFNGLNVPAEFNADQLAMFDGLVIDVKAKAIQADNMGIADEYKDDEKYGEAKTAFAILAGGINAKDVGVNNTPDTIEVTDLTVLKDAIANAKAGDIIKLSNDIGLGNNQLDIDKDITLDLGGKKITADYGWGIISLKNGASIKNGTIDVVTNVAAIRAFNAGSIKDVTINVTPKATDKVTTGIAVQGGGYAGTIKNVKITGASQGIEVYKGAKVDLIENADVTAVSNGTEKGIALQINAGNVGKVINSSLNGDVYGVHMMLNGENEVALTLENCEVTGTTASIYAHDEKGISNINSCSLTLTYDAETELNGELNWDFEEECKSVVTLNAPSAN